MTRMSRMKSKRKQEAKLYFIWVEERSWDKESWRGRRMGGESKISTLDIKKTLRSMSVCKY